MPDSSRINLPMQTRLVPLGSVNKESRTVDAVWTTGARVKRYDWSRDQTYWEELSLDPAHVRMGRLQSGSAPVLNAHNRWSLEDQIGVVEGAALGRGQGTAQLRFSAREDVQPIFQDIVDKIIRNVSVGYSVYRYEQLPPDATSEGLPIRRAVDWEPQEISPVPLGADAGAGMRSEQQQRTTPCEIVDFPANPAITRQEHEMTDAENAALAAAESAKLEAQRAAAAETLAAATRAATEATAAERGRLRLIDDLCTRHNLPADFRTALVDGGDSAEQVRAKVLDKLAAGTTEIRSGQLGIHTVADETDKRRDVIVNALLHRANPGRVTLMEDAKPWRGYTLREIMRKCLELRGVRTEGMSQNQMWERTYLNGSDLPQIVLDAATKSLRAAYEVTPRTFVPWCRASTAPDFKNINRIQMSGAPALLEVKSGGEILRGNVSDGKESYALVTYARIIGINRQTIINDDMSAFTRLPELCATAAADLESDTVYGIITTNGTLQTSGFALFSTGHTNNTTGASPGPSVADLGTGRARMRLQTGLEGRPINVRPSFLIVPAALESLAEQFTSQAYVAAVSSNINPFASGGRNPLIPIVEPRLDANSAAAWYLAADPAQVDTIEYAYLEGEAGPYLETRMGFDVDGMELKVRLDFAAKALDYRGLYRRAGA